MEVDLSIAIFEYQSRRTVIGAQVISSQSLHDSVDVFKANYDIEVIVLPRLPTNECIDGPTTVEPKWQAEIIQAGKDSEDIVRCHHDRLPLDEHGHDDVDVVVLAHGPQDARTRRVSRLQRHLALF